MTDQKNVLLTSRIAESTMFSIVEIKDAKSTHTWHMIEISFCDGGGSSTTMFLNPHGGFPECLKELGCELIKIASLIMEKSKSDG